MARIQILELPAVEKPDGGEEIPFLLVIDQFEESIRSLRTAVEGFRDLKDEVGARAVLVFQETVELPANEVPVDPDGYPLKFRIEPDFEEFRQQVDEDIRYTQGKVTRALREP